MNEHTKETLRSKEVWADCPTCGYEGYIYVDTVVVAPDGTMKLMTVHTKDCPVLITAITSIVDGANSQNTFRDFRTGEIIVKTNDVRPLPLNDL